MAHKAIQIADVVLSLSCPECGDIISNLKMQKLLYYCQGFNLAINGSPLFDDTIEKWQYGPVVPNVYRHYKRFGSGAIELPKDFTSDFLSTEELEVIKEVYEVYGQFSAVRLMEMTHNESPWVSAEMNGAIELKALQDFFKNFVSNG